MFEKNRSGSVAVRSLGGWLVFLPILFGLHGQLNGVARAGVSGSAAGALLPATGEQAQARWHELFEAADPGPAESICTSFLESQNPEVVAEGHKCLANFALTKATTVTLDGDTLRRGFGGPGVDSALDHLCSAIMSASRDAGAHQARLALLLKAERYSELLTALEDSDSRIHGDRALEMELSFGPILSERRQYAIGLIYVRILEQAYPQDDRVLGAVGAFLMFLERESEAIVYLEKAAEINPRDSVNQWNLARFYDRKNDVLRARRHYAAALFSEDDPERFGQFYCRYAGFLERFGSRARACQLERRYCGAGEAPACVPLEPGGSKPNPEAANDASPEPGEKGDN